MAASAADASHLTTEFVSRFDRERRAYPAISLAAHGGDITVGTQPGQGAAFHVRLPLAASVDKAT